jgi:AcrR family transcriptional regulator
VYFHFKDKQAVLKALLDRVRSTVLEPLIRNVESGTGTPTGRLTAFLHHEARVASQDPAMLLLPIIISMEFDGRGNEIDKYVKGGYRRIERMLERVLQEGVEKGEFRNDISPREHANILVALNDGMMLAWLRRGHRLDGAALVRAMRTTLWQGISAAGQVEQSDRRNADKPYLKLAMIRR